MLRYLYCETITGEWWYHDFKTGKDLPMYSTPINIYETLDNNVEEDE